jgi:ribose transport system substrate-binding protein
MKNRTRLIALVLSVLMLVALFAGCGSGGEKESAAPAASTPAASAPAASAPAAESSAPAAAEQSSLDKLLAMKDRLPLNGIQPKVLEYRSSIEKATNVEQKSDVTIGWCMSTLGASFFEEMLSYAQDKCDEYGYTLLVSNADSNLETQTTQIDSYITQGVDVLFINAVRIDAQRADIQRAVDAGIPVIVTGPSPVPNDFPVVTSFISASNDAGFQVGSYVAKQLWEKDKVMDIGLTVINMSDGDSNSRPCGWIAGYIYTAAELSGNPYKNKYDAILEAYDIFIEIRDKGSCDVSEKYGLNFLGYGQGGNVSIAAGETAAADLLTAHPDLDMILCEEDDLAIGVLNEMNAHGIVPGKDMLISCCGNGYYQGLQAIMDGKIMCTATNLPGYVSDGVMNLIHAMFEENYDASNLCATCYTPIDVITIDNVKDFYNENGDYALPVTRTYAKTIEDYNKEHAND